MKKFMFIRCIYYLFGIVAMYQTLVSGSVYRDNADDAKAKRQSTFSPEYLFTNPKTSSQLKQFNYDDNHKPMFNNCANYKPEVKEEQGKGKHVIQVKAYDNDPKDMGGTVKYRIVQRDGDRVLFTINDTTGDVVTSQNFDRDEPYRQKELYLTIQAIDNGRPPLADICTFKVTITDINDNPPIFDQQIFEGQVSEDLKVNGEVMRVFAYDYDDGENSRLTYNFKTSAPGWRDFEQYFRIDNKTGVIYLKQQLVQKTNNVFTTQVKVHDNGKEQLHSVADVKISVVSYDKQPPKFIKYPLEPIYLKENFNDIEFVLANLEAVSNINQTSLQFELVKGKTTQTNKDQTFQLSQKGDTEANITLARFLDFETVTEYQLTVRVINKDLLAASIMIVVKVEDVNDEIPTFIELLTGSVVENDVVGAQAMQVRAIDKDGTSANNIVSYALLDYNDIFEIDNSSGIIIAKTTFDREKEDVYHVTVKAYDNSPSAIKKINNNDPNWVTQKFRISIEDRNDNKPLFTKKTYVEYNISESADMGKDVIEVKALDKDAASLIKYSIIDGNIGEAFSMEETTGRIKVKNKLDFEKIESYNLTVRAFDGIYEDTAEVLIKIQNENDEPPLFEPYNKDISIEEEILIDGCIIKLTAYDPDIKDRNANQRIIYLVGDDQKSFLTVQDENGSGCVSLIKPLDRDKPNGFPKYQAYIFAYDNDGGPNYIKSAAEINIILKDINDNPPFLNITEVVWYENQPSGDIVTLTADDYDSPENGPPFTYSLADEASDDIRNKFSVISDVLKANVIFDREEQKYYDIPIAVTDSGKPVLTGVSILRVIIGDLNDNPAKSGSSEIFVYNYAGQSPDVKIGRVYVDDPDDWDLPDKLFQWENHGHENFELNQDIGMITMKSGTPEGEYELKFIVTENAPPDIPRHEVDATVIVTVKVIPEEAVRKSGSIRMRGTSIEDFIAESPKISKKDLLQERLSEVLNTTKENVDIFTVLTTPNNQSLIDVRFSAHGSPYYLPEKLNSKISEIEDEIQKSLGVEFVMISINECIKETACPPEHSCSNQLIIKDEPAVVFTNKTSFVGVQAVVEAVCQCVTPKPIECFNGGLPLDGGLCNCPEGFEGPHCEILAVAFHGDGWAMYPPFESCNKSEIGLEITTQDDGLIFYVGPLSRYPPPLASDFMSLELIDGYPVLLLDYGTGTTRIELNHKKLNDRKEHRIRILYSPKEIQISVDDCHQSACQKLGEPVGPNALLNVNGPLQLGGTKNDIKLVSAMLNWQHTPTSKGFYGCIRNLTFNDYTYNLGGPGESKNAQPNCNYGYKAAVSFGIDSNFLVAILVCIALLLILLLAVVVHRRKQDNWSEKDMDDTRENIINYEDEGGGEYDTQFDMNVLRREEKAPIKENLYKQGTEVPADISRFLDSKKDACDRDPDNLPFDDVRYYAYEGDGNSTGSLSSLASCTDEGDLKFNYLSNFGPRFRKLADMYGEDPSDDDSQDGGEESWC